ncbi:MAG: hypothetical protein ABFD50_10495 [Smithella sp.]
MKVVKIKVAPFGAYGYVDIDEANEMLKGATHVDTHTIDSTSLGGEKILVIYAFYPDEHVSEKQREMAQRFIESALFEARKAIDVDECGKVKIDNNVLKQIKLGPQK